MGPLTHHSPLLKPKLLWITDPWDTLDHLQDTTLRLAQEALNLGIPTYWSGSDFVLNASSNRLLAIPLTTDLIKKNNLLHFATPEAVDPSIFHHIHYRIDPPIDLNYISTVEKILAKGAKESQIVNPLRLLKTQSEKVPPKSLLHLAPKLQVVQTESEMTLAWNLFQSYPEFITKPMNLAQSKGVKKWITPKKPSEFIQILKSETQDSSEPILVEEYLSEVMSGEVRMWFANGDFIAALKKFPKSGDFRVLIDEGSKIEAYHLNSDEEKIAKEVGKALKNQGAKLAAIDFIAGKISDYNISSPGLLTQLERVHGNQNFAKTILEKII